MPRALCATGRYRRVKTRWKVKTNSFAYDFYRVEQECRIYLRQKNAFKPLRESQVMDGERKCILFVLCTSHIKTDIIDTCTMTDACVEFADLYPDEVYKEVHNREESKNPKTKHMTVYKLFTRGRELSRVLRKSNLHETCHDGLDIPKGTIYAFFTDIPYKERAYLLF